MKNKKFKIFAVLFVLFCSTIQVLAEYVYSTQKLGNGQVIRMCRFSNGKIDYCTMDDALRAMDVINNPQKYMNAQQKAQWKKQQQRDAQETAKMKTEEQYRINLEKATIPNSLEINTAIDNVRAGYNKMNARSNAGVDVSKEKMLLDFRYNSLFTLKTLTVDFENAYHGYKNNAITKFEFDKIIADLHQKDSELKPKYYEIMNVTVDDIEDAIKKADVEKKKAEIANKKKLVQKRLIKQGALYLPSSTSNWVQQGINVLELLK